MPFLESLKQQIGRMISLVVMYKNRSDYHRLINPAIKQLIKNMIFEFSFKIRADWGFVTVINIETITACNLRCSYCPNSIYDRGLMINKLMMKAELFYKIIDELAELGWAGLLAPHSYGEPLLDDRIIEFIRYAKTKIHNLQIDLFTNGELLTVSLYQELIRAGVDIFTVTQHLALPSKGVLEILEHRGKMGSDNVRFTFKKIDFISNRGGIVKVKNENKIFSCIRPIYSIGIDYSGNVLVCCDDYFNQIKVGNVSNDKLIDIWNSPLYREIRKNIKNGKFEFDICKKCALGRPIRTQ